MSYAAALRSYVLDPVGADRILQQGAGTEPPKPWALPTAAHAAPFAESDLGAGGAISCISSASFSFGSGSMAADAPSLAAWMWHLFANDIVDASSLEAMLPQGSQSHGLGLDRLGGLGRPAFGQTGSKTGYGAIAALFPAEQTVVVVFVNDPEFVVEPAVVALLRAATGIQ